MFQHRFKLIIASIIGNSLEWYDFSLYGIFATLFAKHFFPAINQKVAIIGSLGVFAVGYLMRPIGGAIIGHLGDRKSRHVALIIALTTMGIATTLIGFLPTYSEIGTVATLLLIILRMFQGLAVGGEFPGSIVILAEHANPKRQAFTASLSLVGAGLGILAGASIANILTSILSKSALDIWGWRLPFILGILLALLGVYLRQKIWRQDKKEAIEIIKIPILQLIKNYKVELLKSFCILSIAAVITGMLSIFLVTYLTHYLHIPLAIALHLLFLSTMIMLIAFPLSALIADHFNMHRQWLMLGLFLLIVVTYPLFMLMRLGTTGCTISIILLSISYYFAFGAFAPVLIDLFPKEVRYSGVAIMHGLAFSLIGGTSPLVLNALVLKFGITGPAYYIIISAVAALISVHSVRR